MQLDVIRKWVDALRSGNYQQAKGYLKRKRQDGSVGFCCLGVLGDIVSPSAWSKWSPDNPRFQSWNGKEEQLPEDVWYEYVGDVFKSEPYETDGNIYEDEQEVCTQELLATKNDSGYTFDQIANLIEETYLQ
jgi:hypothetical protein